MPPGTVVAESSGGLIDGNVFDVSSPHEFNDSTDRATAHITARNNAYQGVPNTVQACAGPRP